MGSSSGKSIITALFLLALTFSCEMMSFSKAEARSLPQTTEPSIPDMPVIPSNLPKPTGCPLLPSIPTIPQPKINVPPLPANLPNFPSRTTKLPPLHSVPTIPTVPEATISPLPKTPSIPTIPTTKPSIPFFSPPTN